MNFGARRLKEAVESGATNRYIVEVIIRLVSDFGSTSIFLFL